MNPPQKSLAILALCCLCLAAAPRRKDITVTGKLTRAMAIGGESTGWAIQVDGKGAHSLEIDSKNSQQLQQLANKHVQATGRLTQRKGLETGSRTILQVSSIAETFTLQGSEWLLEDLAGAGVIDNIRATLAFPEPGKVSGNGSCNRFFGAAEVNGNAIKLGPLGSTRMACPEAAMNQETKYLNALQSAERFEWKDPYLLLYPHNSEKPLRFTRNTR